MSLQLGENLIILVILMLSELLLILVPILISKKIEKRKFKEELKAIGFLIQDKNAYSIILKIIVGIDIGIFLYIVSGPLLIFYRNVIIKSIFGIEFLERGLPRIITTMPTQPTTIEIIIIIFLQLLITGPSEEGFFRGFVIQKFNAKLKLAYVIIISSTLFTLYHVPPFLVPLETIVSYFGYFFILGLIFGVIFILSKRILLICSVAHSIFNILVLIT